MPQLNIGLSQVVGDRESPPRHASVGISIELDANVLDQPTKLQARIRQLLGVIENSLADERKRGRTEQASQSTHRNGRDNDTSTTGPRSNEVRLATANQVKAICAITRARRVDLAALLRQRFEGRRLEALSLKEASSLIDDLKAESD